MLREIVESNKKIIAKGSEKYIQNIMDKLQDYEEKNGYPYQGYSSYSKDYKVYVLEVDDLGEYNKHKSWIQKIIKGGNV